MNVEKLKESREQWYAAFYRGDSKELARFEAGGFSVVTKSGIQSKKSQVTGIQKAVATGAWFPSDAHKVDVEVSFRVVGEFCIVAGRGLTVANGLAGTPLMFTELWRWAADAWVVESLHHTEIANGI